jgi:hypothetical protein
MYSCTRVLMYACTLVLRVLVYSCTHVITLASRQRIGRVGHVGCITRAGLPGLRAVHGGQRGHRLRWSVAGDQQRPFLVIFASHGVRVVRMPPLCDPSICAQPRRIGECSGKAQ